MTSPVNDSAFMQIALDLAAKGQGSVEPNPMVGCVLVQSGKVIAEGYHQKFGGPHAEVNALRSLPHPSDAGGATAYVTLEPCCHQGKTPPCTAALIDAKVGRVVVAMRDPFGEVNGDGIQQLKEAGITVTVGVLQLDAERLIAPYIKRLRTGRPWVIAKWAMTIDGRIATRTGESRWISGEASRAEVHHLRSRVDSIAVGMGTVSVDDPMLDARLPKGKTPLRVATRMVFCGRRLPALSSRLITTARDIPTLLVTPPSISSGGLSLLVKQGAESLPTDSDDRVGMVRQALDHLGVQGSTNLLVEGGASLLSSFFLADQVDEVHVYLGAKAIGGSSAPGPIGGGGVDHLGDAWPFHLDQLDQFDNDVRAIYRRGECSLNKRGSP